jgi:hypothetical protein
MTDPIPTPETWPPTVELRRDPASAARHLDALRQVLAGPKPSRCVLWVGGGPYWKGVALGVRLLREVGCRLPVEVWHRGDSEPVDAAQVAGLGAAVIDADRLARQLGDRRVNGDDTRGGWEAKTYALTHTSYDQVLYLDADAYCVADPSPLFDLLTPAAPFAYWSDLPGHERDVVWPRVWPDGPAGVPPVQGGQLLLDRRHGRALLDAAHWMNEHSDYYYAHQYGDQDSWRVALAAGAAGYRCLGPADWQAPAFICRHFGTPYVVHRCQGKFLPGASQRPAMHLPREGRVWGILSGLSR